MAEKRHSGEGEGDAVTLVHMPVPRPEGISASRVAQGVAQSAPLPAGVQAIAQSSGDGPMTAGAAALARKSDPPVPDPLSASGLPPDAVHDRDRYLERSVLGEGGMGRIHL